MTRFARSGAYQKKQPHDATSWQDIKSYDSGFTGKRKHTITPMERDNPGTSQQDNSVDRYNKRRYGEVFENNGSSDCKISKRSEFRRQKRINKRESIKVCFNCRKEGHMVAECPEKNKRQGMGICFKCGSTEHNVNDCRAKVKADQYPYATCFICNETGHLSKQCPDNPRGLYPNGGCCKECGSVEHFRRDCPELQKQQGFVDIKAHKLTNFSSADADIIEKSDIPPLKLKKKGPKIVKF